MFAGIFNKVLKMSSQIEKEEVNNNEKGHKDSSNAMLREMAVQKVRERMELLQCNVVNEMDQKLGVIVDELLGEIKRFDVQHNELKQLFQEKTNGLCSNNNNNERKLTNKKGLPEKKFVPCNSLLTDLLEVQHIRTIYHIFIVILFLLFLNTLVHDFVADGTFNIGLYPIKTGFGKFHMVVIIWSVLQILTFALYYVFKLWANGRIIFLKYSQSLKIWDRSFLVALVIYQTLFTVLTVQQVLKHNIPAASSMIILMETVRFLMKSHAFVRSNTPRVLSGKVKAEDSATADMNKIFVPTFKTYLYFLFVPTLVYRDNYPRTKFIRWHRVIWNYIEVIGVIFYVSFIFERFLIPYFQDFGDSNIEPKSLVLSIFGCIMPGTIAYLCGFYCLLHSWMNASAEMLRFADRMFYKDWWNAPSFDVYFRTWNVVVHDWLYTYIYKDIYEHVFRESKTAATLIVFTISALFHELILSVAFRFFYPVMFVMFLGLGTALSCIRFKQLKAFGNIFLWFSIAMGNGLLISLYCMEHFARINCTVNDNSLLEYFVPVSWRCNGISTPDDWQVQTPW